VPIKSKATNTETMIKSYSRPPCAKKNPLARCIFTIATAIRMNNNTEETLAPMPTIRDNPPSNYTYAATYAQRTAGANPSPSKNLENPRIPGPPKMPNTFCEPCAINIIKKLHPARGGIQNLPYEVSAVRKALYTFLRHKKIIAQI
jgi:hypothetical protein